VHLRPVADGVVDGGLAPNGCLYGADPVSDPIGGST
jgi:hypothetical protein